MKPSAALALALVGVASLASACGTTIIVQVIDGAGGGVDAAATSGAGGSGASSSTEAGEVSSATGAMNTTVASGGPTGPADMGCATACGALANCGAAKPFETCVTECEGVAPVCLGAHEAWLQCLATNGAFAVPGCPSSQACAQALMNYVLCKGGCLGGACGGLPGGGTCNCISDCIQSKYETNCFPDGAGNLACECKENGVPVGKCFGPGNDKFCDAMHSCCADLFFIDG